MLCKMVKPTAHDILSTYLPPKEYAAIYYADVEQQSLMEIAENHLNCEEQTVKKYRRSGYEKLASIYFPKD